MLTLSRNTLYLGFALLVIASIGVIMSKQGAFSGTPEPVRWTAIGIVKNSALTPNRVLISHEDIPGLMPAMTMPFTLVSADLLEGVGYNKTIQFEFFQRGDSYVIDRIVAIESDELQADSATSRVADAARFMSSAIRWESEFTNRYGEQVTLADYIEKTLVMNFIYTRCPSICPTQTLHLLEIFKELSDEQRESLVFISISLDPEHDSPETLLAFADQFGIGAQGWAFLTGDREDTERTMNSMNVMSYSVGNNEYNHSSKIYVVKNKGESISAIDDNKENLRKAILHNIALAESQ